MGEAEQVGVQRLARKSGKTHALLRGERGQAPRRPRIPIDRIADHRMTALRQVNADLMGSSRTEPAFDERRHIGEGFQHAVVGESGLPAMRQHRHLLPIARAAADIAADLAGTRCRNAPHQRVIGAAHRPRREGRGEGGVGALAFCDDHEARSILVEAMDDAGATHAADASKAVAAMRQEGVDKGVLGIAGRGMDDETRRLVDDDEVIVLVADVESDRLRLRPVGQRRRHCHGENLARFDPHRRVRYRRAVPGDAAIQDELLDARARHLAKMRREHAVEALAGIRGTGCHLVPARAGRRGGGMPSFIVRHRARGWTQSMRALKALVIILGILLVGGTATLIAGLVLRSSPPRVARPVAELPAPPFESAFDLPAGATIRAADVAGERLLLRIALADGGERILILDIGSGARLGTIELRAPR